MIASIEAPLAFLEEPVKVLLLNTIKFAHLALRLIPEILDAVDMIFTIGEQFAVVDPLMMKR